MALLRSAFKSCEITRRRCANFISQLPGFRNFSLVTWKKYYWRESIIRKMPHPLINFPSLMISYHIERVNWWRRKISNCHFFFAHLHLKQDAKKTEKSYGCRAHTKLFFFQQTIMPNRRRRWWWSSWRWYFQCALFQFSYTVRFKEKDRVNCLNNKQATVIERRH